MELISILEAIAADETDTLEDVVGEEDESVPVTGYELDESDWEALGVIKDGRGDTLADDTISWLRQCGLVEADSIALSQLAIEWMRWAE